MENGFGAIQGDVMLEVGQVRQRWDHGSRVCMPGGFEGKRGIRPGRRSSGYCMASQPGVYVWGGGCPVLGQDGVNKAGQTIASLAQEDTFGIFKQLEGDAGWTWGTARQPGIDFRNGGAVKKGWAGSRIRRYKVAGTAGRWEVRVKGCTVVGVQETPGGVAKE